MNRREYDVQLLWDDGYSYYTPADVRNHDNYPWLTEMEYEYNAPSPGKGPPSWIAIGIDGRNSL